MAIPRDALAPSEDEGEALLEEREQGQGERSSRRLALGLGGLVLLGFAVSVLALWSTQASPATPRLTARELLRSPLLVEAATDQLIATHGNGLHPSSRPFVRKAVVRGLQNLTDSLAQESPELLRRLELLQLSQTQVEAMLRATRNAADPRVQQIGQDVARLVAKSASLHEDREGLKRRLLQEFGPRVAEIQRLRDELLPAELQRGPPGRRLMLDVEKMDLIKTFGHSFETMRPEGVSDAEAEEAAASESESSSGSGAFPALSHDDDSGLAGSAGLALAHSPQTTEQPDSDGNGALPIFGQAAAPEEPDTDESSGSEDTSGSELSAVSAQPSTQKPSTQEPSTQEPPPPEPATAEPSTEPSPPSTSGLPLSVPGTASPLVPRGNLTGMLGFLVPPEDGDPGNPCANGGDANNDGVDDGVVGNELSASDMDCLWLKFERGLGILASLLEQARVALNSVSSTGTAFGKHMRIPYWSKAMVSGLTFATELLDCLMRAGRSTVKQVMCPAKYSSAFMDLVSALSQIDEIEGGGTTAVPLPRSFLPPPPPSSTAMPYWRGW
mmetsp:Transcript_56068/g.121241  ORF Transcript_56068/g.121241 Transcript_56068/m.121241 type:complete len:556 (+) Transcript_56068:59-1726(+)